MNEKDLIVKNKSSFTWEDELIALRFKKLAEKLILVGNKDDNTIIKIEQLVEAFQFSSKQTNQLDYKTYRCMRALQIE